MTLTPQSLAWLVAHDMKMSWRLLADIFKNWSRWSVAGVVASGFLALHTVAGMVIMVDLQSPGMLSRDTLATAGLGVLFWMIAQGLLGATRALYERGHLEVLFSSPLPVWKAVLARALAIAASSFASVGLLTIPLANAGAVIDTTGWLKVYPIEVALALIGTATGFLIAIGLFHAVGPRRARQISQIVAAGIAGAFILGVQIAAILPTGIRARLATDLAVLIAPLQSHLRAAQPLADAVLRGENLGVGALLLLAVAAFGAAVVALSGAFSKASLAAVGNDRGVSAQGQRWYPFHEGISASLRRKEWRLLLRDPNLFAQLSLQIIYTLPVVVILLRGPQDIQPTLAIAPFIVVLATQISASLAWIAVSGEDAPELIQTAPVGAVHASAAKLSAIAVPVVTILAVPLAALALLSPSTALATAIVSACAGASAAVLNFWHPMAGNRRGLLRRHSQSKVIALAEHGLSILWALAIVLALVDVQLVCIPAGGVAVILWLFKPARSMVMRGHAPFVPA
jgi:ABC-2 type transport system permease protein